MCLACDTIGEELLDQEQSDPRAKLRALAEAALLTEDLVIVDNGQSD
jgi:hypothetical protein